MIHITYVCASCGCFLHKYPVIECDCTRAGLETEHLYPEEPAELPPAWIDALSKRAE